MAVNAGADGGTTNISFLVAGNQTVTGVTNGATGNLVINKPSDTVSVTSPNLTVGDFTLTSGTFTAGTGILDVYGAWTHTAGGTFNHNSGTVTWGTTIANSPTWDVAT